MVLPVVLGTIAGQSTVSAPTSVSVATSSSGNYDDSFVIDFQNGQSSGTAFTDHDGSTANVSIDTSTWDGHYSGVIICCSK